MRIRVNNKKVTLNKQIFTVVLFTILFLPVVQSINLSTIQKDTYSQVRIGESAEFIILFWNTEDYPFQIELSVKQASEDLSFIIRPKEFMIEPSLVTTPSTEKGKEYVNTPQGLMEATPVSIIIKPSNSADLGEHDVHIKAVAKSPETGITPLLEKTFKFTVNVTGPPSLSERFRKITSGVTETVKDVSSKITGMVSAGPVTNWILLIISIIVLVLIVWFIRFR